MVATCEISVICFLPFCCFCNYLSLRYKYIYFLGCYLFKESSF